MQKRNVLDSPRLSELKRKRRNTLLRKVIIVALIFIFILVGLSLLTRIDRMNISEVVVQGNKIIDTESIRETADAEIAGKYLWLFPKTNILFYPKNKVISALDDKYKRLKDITLSIQGSQTLLISVAERTGKYIWCGDSFNIDADPKITPCYFLDDDGYVFDEAPYFSGDVYFKFYGLIDKPESTETPSGYYFSKEDFSGIILLKEMLEDLGLKPTALYLEKNGDIRIYLAKAKNSLNNPEVMFKADADLEIVRENLKAALDTEPLKTDFKNKYSSLLYIDLRFGNKVYYKFK